MKHILSPTYPARPRVLTATRPIILVLTSLLVASGAVANEVPFSTQNVIDLAFLDARSVETIDIDGDGDLDVMAVAQGSQDDVGWFENTAGDGSAWTERLITDGLTNPGWARAGDIDGDGDLDVVAADLGDLANTGQVVWLENTGSYGAAWPQTVIATFNGVEPVEVGDLDGDGDLDVVASSFLIDDVVWYENTGAGATWAAARKIDDFLQGKGLAIYDVDRDGDLDVGTAAPDGFGRVDFGKVTWSENPGPAAIGAAVSWTRHELNDALFDGARGLCFADIDGDGDVDAGAAADGDGGQPDAIAWFENSGDDDSFTTHILDSTFDGPKVVYCFDLDEDGDPDLLSVSNDGDGVAWFENPGDTTSAWPRHTIQLVFTNGQNVWAGDIDGDGRLDVAAVSRNDMVSWWQNQEIQRNAAFHREEVADADHQGASGVGVGDVDGDSRGEIVAGAATEGKITIYERDADTATWSVLTDVTSSATGIQELAVADIDADGDLDIVGAVDSTTDELQYWKDTAGDGSAWSTANTLGTLSDGRGVALADIDGDGDLDAVAAASGSDDFFWYENDGSDSGWTRTEIVDGGAAYTDAADVAPVDVDGDGDIDVLATAEGLDDVIFFENTAGDGSAWSSVTIDAAFSGARGIAYGDIDADGDVDAVAAATDGDDISWWSNTAGDGSAWSETTIAVNTAAGVDQVAVTDLDGDGDADVVATIGTTGAVRFYENTAGDGSAWSAHDLLTAFAGASGLALGDLERNGLTGFAATASTDNDVSWMANVGGQFALPTTDVAPGALGNADHEDMFELEATHNGLVGENDVELTAIELLFEILPSEEPMLSAELQTIIDDIEIWLDDGDDTWASGSDTLVATLDTPITDEDGIASVVLADGDPDAAISQGTPETYFVVFRTTGSYTTAPLDSFRVTHKTQASSRGEDAGRDTGLRLEGTTDVTTGSFDVNPGGTPSADLRVVTILDSLDPAMPSDSVTYTVTVTNDGPWAAEAVSVAHTLPSGSTLTSTSGCTNDPMASPCSLGTIRLGESVMFDVTVELPSDASGSVTYTATASTSTADPDGGNNSLDEITTIQQPGALVIGKSLTATGTTGSFAFKYYVAVNNTGGIAEPTASVVDNLPGQLTGPTWTCSGTGGASCTASGSGNISESVNLPAGGGVTFVVDGTVTATTGTMTNTATVTGVESNDSTTHTLRLDGLIFADGFESGNVSVWTTSFGGP